MNEAVELVLALENLWSLLVPSPLGYKLLRALFLLVVWHLSQPALGRIVPADVCGHWRLHRIQGHNDIVGNGHNR